MQVAIRVKESELEQASWQADGCCKIWDRVGIVDKFVSMCLFGVKVVASYRLMCSVGYGMNSSWEMCTCKWQFVFGR